MPTHEDLVAAAAQFKEIHHLSSEDERRTALVLDFVRRLCTGEEMIVVMAVAAGLIVEIQEQLDLDDAETQLDAARKWGKRADAR